MSEATALYLRLKGYGKDEVFARTAERNAACVIEVLGDRSINDYASNRGFLFFFGNGLLLRYGVVYFCMGRFENR